MGWRGERKTFTTNGLKGVLFCEGGVRPRRCASRRHRGHAANEREAWEGAGRPAGLSFAIVIVASVVIDVVENTMSPEPKLDPDCPRRSVRAARLLLYDPDGSELNGKYGSAFFR